MAAGGDDDVVGVIFLLPYNHCRGVFKPGVTLHDVHFSFAEHSVDTFAESVDHFLAALDHLVEIDLESNLFHAEFIGGVAADVDHGGIFHHAFRRDAPFVEARSAEAAAVDQRHLLSSRCGLQGGFISPGAGSYDN